jgi:hypothetical protein
MANATYEIAQERDRGTTEEEWRDMITAMWPTIDANIRDFILTHTYRISRWKQPREVAARLEQDCLAATWRMQNNQQKKPH